MIFLRSRGSLESGFLHKISRSCNMSDSSRIIVVSSEALDKRSLRLDAPAYASEGKIALQTIKKHPTKPLSWFCEEIFNLPRFKRIYTPNPSLGWPYLSASETLLPILPKRRFLAKSQVPTNPEKYFVKDGWILLTCSGTIGKLRLATPIFDGFFVTHDIIRIVPKRESGYLYAFLASEYGQVLLEKGRYGGPIKHLEPHHIENLPVPLLPDDIRKKIDREVRRAWSVRDEASNLEEEATDTIESLIFKKTR